MSKTYKKNHDSDYDGGRKIKNAPQKGRNNWPSHKKKLMSLYHVNPVSNDDEDDEDDNNIYIPQRRV